jgi:hypothetical protein
VKFDELSEEYRAQLNAISPPQFIIPTCRDTLVGKIEKEMSAGFDTNDVTKIIVVGSIYYHVGNFEAALRVLRQAENLEW